MIAPTCRLSPRFRAVLDYVLTYHGEHGYAPSVREIIHATDYQSTSSVAYALRQIAQAGYIRIGDPGQSRAIDVRPAQQTRA